MRNIKYVILFIYFSLIDFVLRFCFFDEAACYNVLSKPLLPCLSLQDKRNEHVRFCKYAAELIERVSGKPLLMGTDVSLARLQRASVVAQSRISFPEKELLLLIRNHLVAKGLNDTATTLTKEADLPMAPLAHAHGHGHAHPHGSHAVPPFVAPGVSIAASATPAAILPRTPRLANGVAARLGSHASTSGSPSLLLTGARASTSQLHVPPPSTSSSSLSATASSSALALTANPQTSSSSSITTAPQPSANGSPLIGRIVFTRERPSPCATGRKPRVLRQKSDHGAFSQSPAMKKQLDRHLPSPPALDSIITEYLREQHARCKNPVTTCPLFSLFTPHQVCMRHTTTAANASYVSKVY